jgi:predicted dehydrogenase
MKNKLNFGIIGAGGIAQTYVQAFTATDKAKIVAIADIRSESAKALAEICGATVFENYKDLAKIENLDAVIVATPPATHTEIAIYFLNRKIHTLCEKPLCLSQSEAGEIIAAAERAGAVFTMASKFRYCADVVKAKAIMASGVLGEIVQFENAFTARVEMSRRWNSNARMSGGGVLIDNGTHSVDIIRYFLGAIESVLAVDAGRTQNLSVEENVKMLCKTVGGITASVDLAWGINKELPNFICIYGTNGALQIGWRESKYKIYSSPDWVTFGKGYDKIQAFCSKIENFAGKINGAEELLINSSDTLASVQVIEAAYKSLNQNLWTRV